MRLGARTKARNDDSEDDGDFEHREEELEFACFLDAEIVEDRDKDSGRDRPQADRS